MLTLMVAIGIGAARADDWIDKFETQLDFTIRSACHGNMIDAIPDFLSAARDWLNDSTPFCQTVRTLPDDASAAALLQQQVRKTRGASYEFKRDARFVSRMQQYYEKQQRYDFECQDWMCQHIRTKVWRNGNPITLADYRKVAAHCGDSYGCIENWFDSWPRALPSQKVQLSLDSLLDAQTSQARAAASDSNAGAGLSLDNLMGETEQNSLANVAAVQTASSEPTSAAGSALSLDDVFDGRAQVALESATKTLDAVSQQLGRQCDCSISGTGCYTVPSRDLLSVANTIEANRYQLCEEWQQRESGTPASSEAATVLTQWMKDQQRRVANLDSQVSQNIADWRQQQRRLEQQARRAQQQRNDDAFWGGMGALALQVPGLAQGGLTPEQAAQNAVNASKRIQNSGSTFKRQEEGKFKTSVPGFVGGSNQLAPADSAFACYAPRARICVEYGIVSAAKAQQVRNQCQQGGNRLLDSCDRTGTSCTFTTAAGSETTFSYDSSAATVRAACNSRGGVFESY